MWENIQTEYQIHCENYSNLYQIHSGKLFKLSFKYTVENYLNWVSNTQWETIQIEYQIYFEKLFKLNN